MDTAKVVARVAASDMEPTTTGAPVAPDRLAEPSAATTGMR